MVERKDKGEGRNRGRNNRSVTVISAECDYRIPRSVLGRSRVLVLGLLRLEEVGQELDGIGRTLLCDRSQSLEQNGYDGGVEVLAGGNAARDLRERASIRRRLSLRLGQGSRGLRLLGQVSNGGGGLDGGGSCGVDLHCEYG
ncbi:hypothetical protein PFISCL1PPCAC_29003, partial [Pristionchus fissidentatus]